KANKSKSVSNRGAIHECCDIQDHSLDSSCNQKRWRTFRVDHFLFNYLNKTEKNTTTAADLKKKKKTYGRQKHITLLANSNELARDHQYHTE
ncbi:AAEL005995-PA, partial [Aedes aegypti]